jgi:beta-lactamase superfamily II metal-dependent hydrolase
MLEIDFLPVGDCEDSGDAIAMRFTRPDTGGVAHVIVDAGFQDDGKALVDHVKKYYGTNQVDLAILTHPDGDHIGGMGKVVSCLDVSELWLHQIGAHGGSTLPAAKAVDDLIGVATENGTVVHEAWAGAQRFGGALTVLGPDKPYYDALVEEQLVERDQRFAAPISKSLLEAARGLFDRITDALDIEIPFAEKDVTARNNSSLICLLTLEGHHHLLTADAGVPALDRAWTYAESAGIAEVPVLVQIPHHGSRRNASSAWLTRLLGEPGQAECRSAFVSVVPESEKHPSGKVVNAYKRRGCKVVPTAGSGKYYFQGTQLRAGWEPAEGLGPMVEEED